MMKPYTIAVVAGARPNFMKIAPIVRALNARKDCPSGYSDDR